tara:strand:+ start:103494 stop:104165 length:672 start_codon:yes stop_codon:yes gene_type:complete
MNDMNIPKTAIVEYDSGVTMHFVKSKYDNCIWNKNFSTWEMLKNRYDNGERDSQRQKLYDAEYNLIPPADDNSMEFSDVILKIAEIVNDTWFRKKFGRLFSDAELKVENASTRQKMAYAYGSTQLSFPPNFCNTPIIIHELTHIITDRLSYVVHFRKNYATHGRMFAFIYLELVKKYMGDNAHRVLKAGYKNFNVKYHNRIPQTSVKKKMLRERLIKNFNVKK